MNKIIHVKTQEECDKVLEKIERDYPDVRWVGEGEKPTEWEGIYEIIG